ncbi:beta-eliminating lyase-related protein [Brevibacterium aurantiacum]|uniref:Aromatic amino acid beta-eliminating lyase/threonine aldolase domain-containing protein n=1 Tax=Brevibacterium aurantiacum TaxID=273384 RepID=A0A556C601_BREAU|nr:beta-eliminating lyase-related protein [Brevibacterium aurantiacum]TSI12428.1 hypothetical protein FO013_20040 [Brevibacterium aurantiacum]
MVEWIDLRSDTVTKPTGEMRAAMAAAEVGDDGRMLPDGQYGDLTVRRLEEAVALELDKPAAIFVTTGVLANMIALRTWCKREATIAVGANSHILRFERGAFDPEVFGLRARPLADSCGFPEVAAGGLDGAQVLCLENTHNAAGGVPWHVEKVETLRTQHASLPSIHLDGARLFNASVALGVPLSQLASVSDSVMVCLSKGLGAPMGSVLAGPTEWIAEARKMRQLLGGQLRQVGVVAAAGLIALRGYRDRLETDQARAKLLAERLRNIPQIEVDDKIKTNIVRARFIGGSDPAFRVRSFAAKHGVLLGGPSGQELRFVLHSDISNSGIDQATNVISHALSQET